MPEITKKRHSRVFKSLHIQRTGQISGYGSLNTQGQQAIAAQGATVDLADAANTTSLQTLGTIRANSPQREADIRTLESASHSTDPTQQTELATLQRINQAMLLQLRTQQEASQMTQTQSLQQMVQQKQQQDALKMSMQAADGYSPDRRGEHPQQHLKTFKGVLQADAYAGFNKLHEDGAIRQAPCLAHIRRKFYDLVEAQRSPIATEAVRRIGELYAIEREIRGRSPDLRQQVRQARAKPLLDSMRNWMAQSLASLSRKVRCGGRDPLCARAVGRALALHRQRRHRDRQLSRRAIPARRRPWKKKLSLRRFRPRRRTRCRHLCPDWLRHTQRHRS